MNLEKERVFSKSNKQRVKKLLKIEELEQEIRDFVNDEDLYDLYFKKNRDEWMTLCASMDILGDTCHALYYFEATGLGKRYGEIDDGEKYLKLYGFFQAIFLQQDAIKQIYKIFNEKEFKSNQDSAWIQIRDLRNLIIGHPTEKRIGKDTKRCFLTRVTMSDNGLDILITSKKGLKDEIKTVDFMKTYDSYKKEVVYVLKEINQAQIKWKSSLK